jgi:hypothetical protein
MAALSVGPSFTFVSIFFTCSKRVCCLVLSWLPLPVLLVLQHCPGLLYLLSYNPPVLEVLSWLSCRCWISKALLCTILLIFSLSCLVLSHPFFLSYLRRPAYFRVILLPSPVQSYFLSDPGFSYSPILICPLYVHMLCPVLFCFSFQSCRVICIPSSPVMV